MIRFCHLERHGLEEKVPEKLPNDRLGVVTDGSFTSGLTVRLDSHDAEELQVGSFVVVEGGQNRYFSLINDLQLRVADQGVAAAPPNGSAFIRKVLEGIETYAAAIVRPSLVLENAGNLLDGDPQPRAVRTIPSHFSMLRRAQDQDFALVFGEESDKRFAIGSPIANDSVMIPVDLERLIERSNGIFGQTGTGKSVLTLLMLFGLIRSDLASTLIFDMHDEYAEGPPSDPSIPGLRSLFGGQRVRVYHLDRRAAGSDPQIAIGMNQIRPEDIELLADELDLRDTFAASSYALTKAFGDEWLSRLLALDGEELTEFCNTSDAHEGALRGLQRKLRYLEAADYIISHSTDDPVSQILKHLESGKHVIIRFGRHGYLRDYMLVANILTRRIHEKYIERAEPANRDVHARPLVVVLEEAHKFLNPTAARQSIFGTIAREMRKFGVSLLVVDQRPSGIDSEILSQLGTRITGQLTDGADIDAVLSGTGDRSAMRAMLASLEPRQQCLVVGHAMPMPMILQTRQYSNELRSLLDAQREVTDEISAMLRGDVDI